MNSQGIVQNYGTLAVTEKLGSGEGTHGGQIINHQTLTFKTADLSAFIDNYGSVTGESLTLTTGAEEQNGTLAGNGTTNEKSGTMNLGSLTLKGLTEFEAGAYRAGAMRNDGVLNVPGEMSVSGLFNNSNKTHVGTLAVNDKGKVINSGTLTASGTVTVDMNATIEGTGTIEATQVSVSPNNIGGAATLIQNTLKVTGDAGILNNGTICINNLETTKVQNNNGQLEVGSATVTDVLENHSQVTISDKADINQLLQYSGAIQGEKATLSADDVTVNDGTVNVGTLEVSNIMTVSGGSLEAGVWKLGSETTISGGTINVKDIQSQNSAIIFKGNQWSFAEGSDWFNGATINFDEGVDYTMKEMGEGNTLYVHNGGTLRIDELNNDSKVFVSRGGTLVVGTVNDSTVSMLGGTLQTSLDQLFTFDTEGGDQPVDAEGKPYDEILFGDNTVITGVRDEIGNWNKTLNGSLQLSGDYVLGQNIAQITDVLVDNGFDTSDSELVLTGEIKNSEANITTIKDLLNSGKYDAGLILANTSFENREASDQAYQVKAEFDSSYGGNSFGFKDIAGAAEVEVSGGNHLTLVGSSDVENYKDADLLERITGKDTSITLNGGNEAGYLTLGLAGGQATKGWVDKIIDNNDSGDVSLIVQNGDFGTNEWSAAKSEIKNSGHLTVEGTATIKDVVTVTNGSLSLNDVSFGQYGQIVNNDLLQITQGTIGGKGLVNNTYAKIDSVTVESQLENNAMLDVSGSLTISNGQFANKDGLVSIENLTLAENSKDAFVQAGGETTIKTFDAQAGSTWIMAGGQLNITTYQGTGQLTMQGGDLTITDYQAESPVIVSSGRLALESIGTQGVLVNGENGQEAVFQTTNNGLIEGSITVANNAHAVFGSVDRDYQVAGTPENGTRVTFAQQTTLADNATLNVGGTKKAVINANFGEKSVTVVDAGALGTDKAALVAGAENQILVVEEGAQLIIGNAKDQGNYVVTEGFDLSGNFDTEGNWIGGWADGVKVLSQAGTGLGFDIEFNTNEEDGSIYVTTVLNDVSVLYPNIGVQSIANAAVRVEGDMATGLGFVKDVLSSEALTVGEKTNVVNSVAELGLASGSMTVALNDVETVSDSIVNHLSTAQDPSKANGLWVDMLYSSQETDDMKADGHMKYGFETDSYGFIIGYDRQVANSGVRLGAAFSYQNGDLDSTGDVLMTTNDYDTFGLHAYGLWQPTERINVLGNVSYLRSSSEVEQQLGIAGHNKATADIDTDIITAGARVEGVFPVTEDVTFVPHIGARIIHADSGSYDTKIDGAKAFDNDADAATLFQVPIGVAVRMDKTLDSGWTVRPHADLTVIPQFGDTEQDIKVETGAFSDTVSGDVAGEFATKATFGVQATKNNTTIGARYGFTAGDMGRQDHAFKVEVRYAF